ncbi:MAG: hypothetical protein C3F11_03895 [Methylocystaceae bacterium]|nr:MAG: hypothetical protein C3F11_03895 [Methylocystaceae bacterium]
MIVLGAFFERRQWGIVVSAGRSREGFLVSTNGHRPRLEDQGSLHAAIWSPPRAFETRHRPARCNLQVR